MFARRRICFNFKTHLDVHKIKPSDMRKFYSLLLLFAIFTSCKNHSNHATADISSAVLTKLLGSFVGVFGDNKITMLITKAEKGIIEGRTIVGGNDRPFS